MNSSYKQLMPGISKDDGWLICAGGLGAIALAIHYHQAGFGWILYIAEGILIVITGLRLATKGMVELWIAYSWLIWFAVGFAFHLVLLGKSSSWDGWWSPVIDTVGMACCAAFIAHRRRPSATLGERD